MKTTRLPDIPPPLPGDMQCTEDPFAPGTQILNKYTVVRTLGRGGMGVVVAARHNRLGEMHAIKFLLPGAVADRQTLGRFEREARAAARLRGEHAVRVHDVGYTDDERPYMIMEYFEGQNLRTVLRRGPLPIDEAVEYLLQVCDALTEVHAAGIVHRDLKPANLLLTMRPTGTLCVKLLDFGIAKFMGAEKSAEIEEIDLTCDAMIGSLRYMSPEHIASTKSVDWRTDIWALGVTGYELLTGQTPFTGTARMDIMASILDKSKKVECVRPIRPDCPPALENVILRCLEKERQARFQSAAEVARALREAMGLPLPMLAPDRSQMPSVTAPTALSVTDEPERPIEPSSLKMSVQVRRMRGNSAWVGFPIALLLVGSLVYAAAWDGSDKPIKAIAATPETNAPAPIETAMDVSAVDAGNDAPGEKVSNEVATASSAQSSATQKNGPSKLPPRLQVSTKPTTSGGKTRVPTISAKPTPAAQTTTTTTKSIASPKPKQKETFH